MNFYENEHRSIMKLNQNEDFDQEIVTEFKVKKMKYLEKDAEEID